MNLQPSVWKHLLLSDKIFKKFHSFICEDIFHHSDEEEGKERKKERRKEKKFETEISSNLWKDQSKDYNEGNCSTLITFF